MKKSGSPGAITVEVCVTVTLFMMLMFFFLGIFMMFTAQSMVAHVTMQTAESLAMDAWQVQKVQLNELSDADFGKIVSNLVLEFTGQTEENNPNFVSEVEWWKSGMALENAVSRRFLGYLTGGDEEKAAAYIKAVKIDNPAVHWLAAFDFSECKIVDGDLHVIVSYKLNYMFQIWGLQNGLDITQTAVSHLWMDGSSSIQTSPFSVELARWINEVSESKFDNIAAYNKALAMESLANATSSYYDQYREKDMADRGYYDFSYIVDGKVVKGYSSGSGFSVGDGPGATNSIIAVKNVVIDKKEKKMINISVRGTSSGLDWLRNFNFNSPDGMHTGFMQNYDSIRNNEGNIYFDSLGMSLADVISAIQGGSDEYFINVNGHSLGGAVANMYAADLYDRGISKDSMAGYTFATPLPYESGHSFKNDQADYPIYNIINDSDVVTHVGAGAVDNGKRAGTDIVFSADDDFRQKHYRIKIDDNGNYDYYLDDMSIQDVFDDLFRIPELIKYEETRHHMDTYYEILNALD